MQPAENTTAIVASLTRQRVGKRAKQAGWRDYLRALSLALRVTHRHAQKQTETSHCEMRQCEMNTLRTVRCANVKCGRFTAGCERFPAGCGQKRQ
eukprot:7998539-Pyramimonas_sp.AAC.1